MKKDCAIVVHKRGRETGREGEREQEYSSRRGDEMWRSSRVLFPRNCDKMDGRKRRAEKEKLVEEKEAEDGRKGSIASLWTEHGMQMD